MYFCYVVRCADGTLYTGVTTDLDRRIGEHNGEHDAARSARYNAGRRPVRLAWTESHPTRSSAQRREAEIKGWRRSRKLALIMDRRETSLRHAVE